MELVSASMQIFAAIFGSFLKVLMFLFLPISLLETVILQRMAQVQGTMIHIDGSMVPTQPQVQQMLEQMMQLMTQEFLRR